MGILKDTFGRAKFLIGVVHVLPLPGSPRWAGDAEAVLGSALADAAAIEAAGFDGLILENFGDAPYARGFAGRGAVAGLAAVGARVAEGCLLPIGINVLRSDARSAVAIAAATGARFVRVNVHTGAALTDQGIIQGDAMGTMRAIREMAPETLVFADVFVKHAVPMGDAGLEQSARDTVERGFASAVIVTGEATGSPAALDHVSRVKDAVPETPVIVGSGVTAESSAPTLEVADGVIVGSAIMRDGRAGGPIDPKRAAGFVAAARRSNGRR